MGVKVLKLVDFPGRDPLTGRYGISGSLLVNGARVIFMKLWGSMYYRR